MRSTSGAAPPSRAGDAARGNGKGGGAIEFNPLVLPVLQRILCSFLTPSRKRTPQCHRCRKSAVEVTQAISTQTPEHTQRPASQATSRAQRPESRFASHKNQSPAMASVLLPESRSRATASARHPESRCPQPDPEPRHAPDGHASVAHQSTAARANTGAVAHSYPS
eukprot:scaffold107993_cov63-Phaeocystis_antarctica.AAC.4